MKTIKVILIVLSFFLISCNPESFEVENKLHSTTVEIMQKAEQDTTLYKIVILSGNMYALNNNTKLVEYRSYNPNTLNTLIIIFLVSFIISMIVHAFRE